MTRPSSASAPVRPLPVLTAFMLVAACGTDTRDMIQDAATGNATGITGTDGDTDSGDDSDGGGSTGSLKFDADPGDGETGPGDCDSTQGGGELEYDFSLIWIANSSQGTVSKIDTITATELARYYTGPGGSDGYDYKLIDPSRTSVNLRGDVVVGNRATHADHSSFTKITGDATKCFDKNADGALQTSSGPTDILEWGEDECVEWHYEVEANGARAVAWEPGEVGQCGTVTDPHVWVAYRGWDGDVHVDLVDGKAGTKIGGAVINDTTLTNPGYGVYGGASDADGNFWANNNGVTAFVDRQTFEWRLGEGGGYGFALDSEGNPWGDWGSGRVAKTDATSGSLVDIYVGAAGGYDRGIAIDENEHLWMVTNDPCGVARFDIPSLTWVDPHITWASCIEPVGVSIDFEGHVWIVDREAHRAVKMKPKDPGQGAEVVAEVTGLQDPYTYSDMTGAALKLVTFPPQG